MASSTYPVLVKSDEERYQQISNLLDENAHYSRLAKANENSMVPGVLPVLGYLGNVMMSLGTMWYNSRQQEKQNQYQEQLIDKQNQYNSPSAQLARLLHAGVPYNTAMQALVGSAVGNQTQPMAGQAAPYTPASPPSLQDSMALQAVSDQHDLTQSEVEKNRAEANNMSVQSDLMNQQIKDMVDRFALYQEKHGVELNILQYGESKAYYDALSVALDVWSRGLYPIDVDTALSILTQNSEEVGEDGKKTSNYIAYSFGGDAAKKFANEFVNNLNKDKSQITSFMKKYGLESVDYDYMLRIYESMVKHDLESMQHDLDLWASQSKVLKRLSESEGLQIMKEFLSTFSSAAAQSAMAGASLIRALR